MASFNKTIITNNGRSLIAKVLSGDQIKFTKMVSSSRDYTSADLSQLTDLSNVEQTILISSIKKTSDSAVKITGIFSNKDLTTGYKFKTVGLYAIDPDLGEILYSVTTASSVDDMPANTGIGLSSITIGLVTEVSNSNNASLEVSDLATVSVLDFNEFKDNVHSQLNDIAKNINGWIVYNDITELGLVSGTETMEKICIAMQDKSVLMYTVVSNVASSNSAYPCSYGGTLKIEKLNINRIKLEYSCGANDTIYSYVGYFYSNKFTGWKEIASGDTGWIDLVLNSGIIARTGATPQIRRIGKQVFLRGSILAKCLSNTSNTALFAIPAGFIPNKLVEFTSISALSLFVDCYILQSNGTVNARISAVTTNESYYFFLDDCASWLVD